MLEYILKPKSALTKVNQRLWTGHPHTDQPSSITLCSTWNWILSSLSRGLQAAHRWKVAISVSIECFSSLCLHHAWRCHLFHLPTSPRLPCHSIATERARQGTDRQPLISIAHGNYSIVSLTRAHSDHRLSTRTNRSDCGCICQSWPKIAAAAEMLLKNASAIWLDSENAAHSDVRCIGKATLQY